MPKLKTRKALAKRVKITKNKKVLKSKAGRRHLLSAKSKKRKRNLRRRTLAAKAGRQLARRALPYS